MDAYLGYNQILVNPADQEATTFVTDLGMFCYRVMPFGLKNEGATYHRLMNMLFVDYIGKIIEVYVDDMLVKTNIPHPKFALIKFGMRLNPDKCYFGITTRKFLGYLVSKRGIKVNPLKIQDILKMSAPTTKDGILHLAGKLNALSRFTLKLTDKCAPFFRALKRSKIKFIKWTPKCEAAL